MKTKKSRRGFTLVETVLACTLLMVIISMLGSIIIFTLNLSYRTKEASQVEILADTLANEVDVLLRNAQGYGKAAGGKGIYFTSPTYPPYYTEIKDEEDEVTGFKENYAVLKCAEADGERTQAGTLYIQYAKNTIPVVPYEILLLPNDSYENMTATLTVDWDKSTEKVLRMNLTLNGTKYHTSCSRDFSVLMPNGSLLKDE